MSGESPKPNPAPAAPATGAAQRLGKYDIERKLGAGGMGTVYLAKDRDLKRTVALKVLPKDRAENPLLVKRFKAEGQAGAHLQHKNIIAVYESGEIDGFLYLALEYVDGIDLLEWIRKRGILPVRRTLEIMKQVAEALQHAYEKQVVHRDIKPSNIMIKSDGTVKLADMGLARIVDDTLDTGITRAGTTVGTVDYMSPEQARSSKAADIRSDLYSLGCTWYHMLTARIPYPEGSLTNKLQAHASGPVPDPREFNTQIPEGVVAVIQRLMSKRPEDRYQTPAELLKDIANPHLARGGISANMLAALAGEGEPQPDSTDFIVHKGNPTPLAVSNTPTRTDVDVVSESLLESPQELPEEPTTSNARGAGKKKKGKAADAPAAETGTVSGRTATTKGGEKPVKSRPLPAKAKGVSSEPAGGSSTGWGLALDMQKLGMILAGIIVVVVGITWGVQALPGLFSPAAPEPPTQALSLDAENRMIEERPQPQPIEMAPENETPPPPVTTVEYVPIEFPGLDDATAGPNELLARLVPDWLRKGWGGPPSGIPVIPVEPRGQTTGIHTLQEAPGRLSKGSAILEFNGSGPYQVDRALFEKPQGTLVQNVTIRGPEGARTTLVMQATDEHSAWLTMSRGLLRLERINLVVINRHGSKPFHVIDLVDSDLIATDCTWTAIAAPGSEASRSMIGVRSTGASVGHNRVLVTNSTFHGLTALACEAPEWDVLCGNCWFDCRGGNCLTVEPPQPIDRQLSAPVRRIAVLGSILSSDRDLFRASHQGIGGPPVELRLRRCGLAGTGPEACAVRLLNWPKSEATNLEAPVAAQVVFEYEHIRLLNCPTLTAFTPPDGEVLNVTDLAGWRQFWKEPLSPEAIRQAAPLPRQPTDLLEPATVVATWETELGPVQSGLPFYGFDPGQISSLDLGLGERLAAAAQRPVLPAGFGEPLAEAPVLRFDLARARQLNDYLNGPQCPSGATVVCFGVGLKMLPLLQLQGKTIRLQFEQSEAGAPLDIQPLADLGGDVWIDVQGGHLDLINAPLSLPASGKKKYPQTLVRWNGASGSIQRSRLVSLGASGSTPLLDVSAGTEPRSLLLTDSFLHSSGPLLRLPPTGNYAEITNSLLATTGTAIQIQGDTQQSGSQWLVYQSTILARRGWELQDRAATGLCTVFAKDAVFLPTPGSDSPSTLWFAVDHTAGLGLGWWESGCGFAPQLDRWLRFGSDSSVVAFEEDRERFPSAHFADAVLGDGGVLLSAPLPEFAQLTAEAVALLPASQAGNWAEGGGPIGVRNPIGPDHTPPKTEATPGTPTNPRPNTGRPGRVRPDF